MDWFYHKVGNFGIAILIVTVLIKILFFPLANKSRRVRRRLRNAPSTSSPADTRKIAGVKLNVLTA